MAQAFNLTAQINLQAPANLKTVAAQIRRELGTVSADVKVNISQQSARSIETVTRRLEVMNSVLIQARNNASSLEQSFRNLGSSLSSIRSSTDKVSKGFTDTSSSVANTAKGIQVATTQMEEFGKQSFLAIKRFAAFSVVTTGVFSLVNAVTSGFKAFVEFDRELIKLQQVTGKGAIGLRGLEKEITGLATSLGVSSKSLVEVASTLAQAGLSAEETRVALSALAKTELAPSFDNLTDTTEGAIAALRQFGLEAKDLEKALGSINAVAAAFAVESKDIIAAIQRTGGVFAASSKGVSEGTDALNEFIAVFTSVRATTRESAETIATGLRTIFTRIQRAKTIDQLKQFGVELTDLEGKFVGPFEAVKRLSEALSRLDPRDLRFSSIVEELGGFRQIGKVIPLIQQFATAQEALKVAQKGQGSLTEAQITAQKSLANQLAKVREQFLALIRDIGKSNTFQALFKVVTGLASGLISLAGAFKPILPILAIMGAVKGASAITQFSSGFFGSMKKAGGAGAVGTNLGESISGAKEKESNDIKQRANSIISENTGAIKTLTNAMNSLAANVLDNTRTIASSTTRGLNSGGIVRKFARGGVVPGSGNGDTVPAMLEPGEFVIRKKAVETIGADKLHKMNRYASGGTVDQIASTSGVSEQFKNAVVKTPEEPFVRGSAINSTDRLRANIKYRKISDNMIKKDIASGQVSSNLLKKLNSSDIAEKGEAFEDYLVKSKKTNLTRTSKKSKIYPVDFEGNNRYGEAKNIQGNLNENIYIDKLFRARVSDGSYSKVKVTPTSAGNQDINLGDLEVFYRGFFKGGAVKRFMAGGAVSEEEAARASRKSIIDVLSRRPGGIDTTARKVGVSAAEIYTILGQRNPDAKTKALQDAIRNEYMVTANRRSGAAKGQLTRLANQNLVVGAAGMFGNKFADTTETINSPLLSSSPKVRIISGVMDPAIASKLESIFMDNSEQITSKAAESVMVSDILSRLGLGKELNLDFDRTLATGADNILSDPGTPTFSEFSNRTKVAEALRGARLTDLGKGLVELVKEKTELLSFMRVVSARPQSTLDLVQGWLSAQGLPIPLSQFKGFGGEGVSAKDIASLKAAFLNPGSLFVDDDERNIQAANLRKSDDISTYQYGTGRSMANPKADADIQGLLLEKVIQKLGGPGAVSGFGFDFPNGLEAAAKYFGLPDNIPTDVKRTISGPSTIKDNLVTYLKNVMGYNKGGIIQKLKLGGQVYDLQKNTGLSNSEFDQLVQFGNTNDYTEQEFKDYLVSYLKNKAEKKNLRINTAQLRDVLLSGTRTQPATSAQLTLAQQLMGEPDAKYNPKYDNARRPFASGGSVEDTVPALLTPGEFVINKKAAQKIGYGKLNRLNKADKLQGFNRGGRVQRFIEGGSPKAIENAESLPTISIESPQPISTERILQNILRVLVAQEKNTKTLGGQQAIETLSELIANLSTDTSSSSDAIVKAATLLRTLAVANKAQGNDDRAQSLKNVFDSLDRLNKSRGGSSLLEATDFVVERRQTRPQTQTQDTDQFSAFRGYQGGGGGQPPSGPTPPFPEDLMPLTTATKVAAKPKADYGDSQFFEYRGRKEGITSDAFRLNVARRLGKAAYEAKDNFAGRKEEMSYELAGKQDTFTSLASSRANATTEQEKGMVQDRINEEVEAIAKQMKALKPSIQDAEKTAKEMAEAMMAGDLKAAQDKLLAALGNAPGDAEAMNIAMEQMSKELGISVEMLKRNFGEGKGAKDVERQQFIQSREGQRFGRLAEFAPDLLSKFSGSRAGKAVGGAADFISGKGGKFSQLFANAGGLVGVGSGVAAVADQAKQFLPVSMQKDPNTQGALGAIGGVGSGAASGALIGAQVAGPVGALVAGIGGAIIGGIDGWFAGKNAQALTNTLDAITKSGGDLDAAFKKLDQSSSKENFAQAQKALGGLIENSGKLQDVAFSEGATVGGVATSALGGAAGGAAIGAAIGSFVPIIGTAIGAALGAGIGGLAAGYADYRSKPTQQERSEALQASISSASSKQEAAARLAENQLQSTSTEDIDNIIKNLQNGITSFNPIVDQYTKAMVAATGQSVEEVSAEAKQRASLDAFMKARKEAGATDDAIAKEIEANRNKAIKEGEQVINANALLIAKQQLLARATKEVTIATENLLDVYRRVNANIKRYESELDQTINDMNSMIGNLSGNSSVPNVNRQNEQVLGNLSAYSADEVRNAANNTAGLLGGTPEAQDLANTASAAKILQDQLPAMLRNAGTEDKNVVVDQLRDMLPQSAAVDQVLEEIQNRINKDTTSDGESIGTLIEDIDNNIISKFSQTAQEGANTLKSVAETYNNTLQKAIDLQNDYNKTIMESDSYMRKAQVVRLNAEVELAQALGNSPTLKELNKAFDFEVSSLTSDLVKSGDILPQNSADPASIARGITSAAERNRQIQEENNAIKNQAIGLGNNPQDEETRRNLNRKQLDNIAAIGKNNVAIEKSRQALEKLANDGSRAANALSKIQERQQLGDNARSLSRRLLTSDSGELADFSRQMNAYTKTISGQANNKELGSLQFRQDAFAGLDNIKSVIPANIAKQMEARLARSMISANPEGQKVLDTVIGVDGQGNPMTVDQSLKMAEEGKDPVQEQYIAEYKKVTEEQALANEALAMLNQDSAKLIQDTMFGLQSFLDTKFPEILKKAVADARADAQAQVDKGKPKDKAPEAPRPQEPTAKQKELEKAKTERDARAQEEQTAIDEEKKAKQAVKNAWFPTIQQSMMAKQATNRRKAATEAKKEAEATVTSMETQVQNEQKTLAATTKSEQQATKPAVTQANSDTSSSSSTTTSEREAKNTQATTIPVSMQRYLDRSKQRTVGVAGSGMKEYLANLNKRVDGVPSSMESYLSNLKQRAGGAQDTSNIAATMTPRDRMLKANRENYLADKKQKRANFLARFRPDVAANFMTDEEKEAAKTNKPEISDKIKKDAMLAGQVHYVNNGQNVAGPSDTSPQRQEALSRLAQMGQEHNASMDDLRRRQAAGETLSPQEINALSVDRESRRASSNITSFPGKPSETTASNYGGPIPTSVPTQQMSQQVASQPQQTNPASGTGYALSLDETSRQFLDTFGQTLNAFGGYVDKLAGITIPDKVTISGNYTVDLKISGAAAIEALDKKIREVGETFVSATDFSSALNQLRDEVSAATKNAVKSSAAKGTNTPGQG